MYICIPQTCLTIRHVNHCKPKLLSILRSPSMIFSSTLWIELETAWGSGYRNAYTHRRNKTLVTPVFLFCYFWLHLFYNIPYQDFGFVICWQSHSTDHISVRNKPEVQSFFLKREEESGWKREEGRKSGNLLKKKKKKWTLKLGSELPKILN